MIVSHFKWQYSSDILATHTILKYLDDLDLCTWAWLVTTTTIFLQAVSTTNILLIFRYAFVRGAF